jgi:hypothetical protein
MASSKTLPQPAPIDSVNVNRLSAPRAVFDIQKEETPPAVSPKTYHMLTLRPNRPYNASSKKYNSTNRKEHCLYKASILSVSLTRKRPSTKQQHKVNPRRSRYIQREGIWSRQPRCNTPSSQSGGKDRDRHRDKPYRCRSGGLLPLPTSSLWPSKTRVFGSNCAKCKPVSTDLFVYLRVT